MGIYYFFEKLSPSKQILSEVQTTRSPCLGENEIVDFPVNEYYSGEDFKYPKFPVVIYIKDKNTNKEKFHFQIDGVRENYYPLEIRRCGIYIIRQFNYDSQKVKQGLTQGVGYRSEFWRYTYDGKGESLFLFHEITDRGEYKSYFATDFRVDPQEIYVVLERGYPDADNYALVMRNLNIGKDDFVLLRQVLLEKYPEFVGYFRLREWTRDGNYFWATLSMTSKVEAFLRILKNVWKVDVLSAPTGTMGGVALNTESGWITYDDGSPWTGVMELDQMYKEQWQKEGKKVHFYLYNLFTKENILLTTIGDPSWSFKPRWLSDTELQYELPVGEKKIYEIKK